MVAVIFLLPFFLVAIGAIVGGIVLLKKSEKNKDYISINATITDITRLYGNSAQYEVGVKYNVNDIEYNSKVAYYSRGMKVGNLISLELNPQDVSRPLVKNDNSTAFKILGVVLICFGSFFIIVPLCSALLMVGILM